VKVGGMTTVEAVLCSNAKDLLLSWKVRFISRSLSSL